MYLQTRFHPFMFDLKYHQNKTTRETERERETKRDIEPERGEGCTKNQINSTVLFIFSSL